jgi:hypothetical protein
VRFLSCEPLLGPVRMDKVAAPNLNAEDNSEGWKFDCLVAPSDYYTLWAENQLGPGERCVDSGDGPYRETRIDWVIAGGESGPGARPMHPDWARSLRDQCAGAGVPFFFKQWGEFVPCVTEHEDNRLVVFEDGAASSAFDSSVSYHVMTAHGREFWHIGKKAAGALLDGVEHKAFPEARQ